MVETLPANLDAERLVLGAVQVDPAAAGQLRHALTAHDFTTEPHRRIWAAACAIHDHGMVVDRVTLAEELQQRGQLHGVGGLSYLVRLDDGPKIADLGTYITLLHEKSERRRFLFACDALQKRAINNEPLETLRSSAQSLLASGLPTSTGNQIRAIDEIPLLRDCGDADTEYIQEPVLVERAVSAVTGGPGSGKSTVVLSWCDAAAREGRPVLILDRENPLPVIRERFRRLRIEDGPALRYYGGWLGEAPAPGSPLVADWVAKCSPSPIVVLDSWVAFHGGNENDASETRAVMHQCRRLADLGAAVVVIHHDGKSDTSRDYRGSSDFKAAIDIGFHVSNSSDDGRLGTLRLRCFKSRFGFAGEIVYYYVDGEFRRDYYEGAPSITAADQLSTLLRQNPGIRAAEFEKLAGQKGLGRNRARTYLADGILAGTVRRETAANNEKRHFAVESVDE